MVVAGLSIFNACQKSELVDPQTIGDAQSQEVIKPDVYVEGDYLVFKDYETYFEISDELNKMNEEQFSTWEKQLGFFSANSVLNEVYGKLDEEESETNYQKVKREYDDRLIFTVDRDIMLPFYASAWQRMLNVKGEMKIGRTIYKFYRDREVMIMDGTKKDLEDLDKIIQDTSKVKVFYPNKNDLLKSVTWGTLQSGSPQIDNMKLEYNYQLISLYYAGYGLTDVYYTENGFDLKIFMRQKRKKVWWSYNKTIYNIIDINLHIELYKMYQGLNFGERYVFNETIPNFTSSETNQGVTFSFLRYYDVMTGYHAQIIPEIYDNTYTFWSRGFDYNNRITISYSNQ